MAAPGDVLITNIGSPGTSRGTLAPEEPVASPGLVVATGRNATDLRTNGGALLR